MRYDIFSKSNCPLLNISSIGYAADPSVTRFGPGVRNLYIIHYVISGKGQFNGNTVLAGQGFLITPAMQECYFPDTEDPWEFLWIISEDQEMEKIFTLLNGDKQTNIFSYDYVYGIREAAAFLMANKRSLFDGFEMLEIFLKIFKYRQKGGLSHEVKTNAQVYMDAAVNYIHSNIHSPIKVSDLTEFLGISQPYLFKIFQDKYSKSPKQYIMEEKLERGKALLKETDLSVSFIANSVGFQDVLAFSKYFRLKSGQSPLNFRKNNSL